MRILILLALLIPSYSWACSTKDQASVNLCTVEDRFFPLFQSMYPSHSGVSIEDFDAAEDKSLLFAFTEQIYSSPSNTPTLTYYDRLEMVDKPLLSAFETELSSWKTMWIERLDFKDSVYSIDRIRRRAALCGLHQPNMELFKKKISKDMDTAKRDCLISKTAELDAEDSARDARKQAFEDAKDRMKARDCSTFPPFQQDICILFGGQ